ncbi:hypothetical protein POVWA1_021500 [Plasmodium ovale wallikeri]|uniref:Uncharacterized protein n=1 Tax=Plasmodium ovale wallikeri TaxID=864142 RepID=A0A1A8YS75_PLAOA|nr:hypothetical protein POVWA1_021500 [Plasmodium ovale wallikeri]
MAVAVAVAVVVGISGYPFRGYPFRGYPFPVIHFRLSISAKPVKHVNTERWEPASEVCVRMRTMLRLCGQTHTHIDTSISVHRCANRCAHAVFVINDPSAVTLCMLNGRAARSLMFVVSKTKKVSFP